MYSVKLFNKKNDELIEERKYNEDSNRAEEYFNLLKTDFINHKTDYYDIEKDIKYSDIKVSLFKDDDEINYFTIG